MPSTRRQLGAFGESLARAQLLRAGYTVLESNWRCRYGEIDLVAQQGDQVVFVEVRTRRAGGPVSAEESLSPAKRRRLLALAECYLEARGLAPNTACRIDLVAIVVDRAGRVGPIAHIVGAVEQE